MSDLFNRKPGLFKPVLAFLLVFILVAGFAQAYELKITAPEKLQRGVPLVVNGTSNIPPGTSVEVVFTKSGFVLEEIARQTVTLQANQEFSVTYDTVPLSKGIYKVEVLPISDYRFLGDSVTLRIVEIEDRSDEIRLRPYLMTQEMSGKLTIAGSLYNAKNSGVQIGVIGPDGRVVRSAEYAKTDVDGNFELYVPITKPGAYNVTFADAKSYIGQVTITVLAPPEPTTIPTTLPQVTPTVSGTSGASRDKPAQFTVYTGTGDVRLSTSSGVDWVIEYTDASGTLQKINDVGEAGGEEAVIHGTGGPVLVTVYPQKYSLSADVTLFAEGATNITAVASPTGTTAGTTTLIPGSAPLPAIVVVVAVIGAALFLIARRKH